MKKTRVFKKAALAYCEHFELVSAIRKDYEVQARDLIVAIEEHLKHIAKTKRVAYNTKKSGRYKRWWLGRSRSDVAPYLYIDDPPTPDFIDGDEIALWGYYDKAKDHPKTMIALQRLGGRADLCCSPIEDENDRYHFVVFCHPWLGRDPAAVVARRVFQVLWEMHKVVRSKRMH